MEKISLNGVWSLYYAPEKQLPETPEALALSDIGRVEATVPGNVELDLFRAGVCPDPFFGETCTSFVNTSFTVGGIRASLPWTRTFCVNA